MRDELELMRAVRPDAPGPDGELTRAARAALVARATSRPRRLGRSRLLAAAAALAVPAALAGASLADRDGGTAWAADAVRVAESAPCYLVAAPGWKVVRADQFSVELGELTFAGGGRELTLRWERGADLAAKFDDPRAGARQVATISVAGLPGRVFRYDGTTDFFVTWRQDGYGVQARGVAADLTAFTAVVTTLRQVGAEAWLSAMPESVVKPAGRAKVVEAMLADVPLPAGFDVDALAAGDTVRDRYQLGARVAGAVACAWLERLFEARASGDAAAEEAAAGALRTARDWQVLRELEARGDYSKVLWEHADAAVAGAPVRGGKPTSVEGSYASALGCGSP